jgi:undecaprenyl pyrophosphate phosphatase UppP
VINVTASVKQMGHGQPHVQLGADPEQRLLKDDREWRRTMSRAFSIIVSLLSVIALGVMAAGVYRRFLVSADQFSLYLIWGGGCLSVASSLAAQVRRRANERGALTWVAPVLGGLALTMLVWIVALI